MRFFFYNFTSFLSRLLCLELAREDAPSSCTSGFTVMTNVDKNAVYFVYIYLT